MAFLVGYIVNTFASWLEPFYFFTWGGKPSSNLIAGKKTWKIKMYNHAALRVHLTSLCSTTTTPSPDELFSIAFRNATGEKDTRMEDFNANYAFSRSLLTTNDRLNSIFN